MSSGQQEASEGAKKGHGAKSQATREQAILALLSERTIEAAATRAGIGYRTLVRWLSEDDEFKQQLAEAQRLAFEAGMARVSSLTTKAIDAFELLLGAKKSPAVRLGAARALMELAIHEDDKRTIMRKLDEIEAFQRQQVGRR